MSALEIKRIEGFQSGPTQCIRCGKELMLWFNGGELDQKGCCGLVYKTEHRQIELVIYEAEVKLT